jgi:hypothetical protein
MLANLNDFDSKIINFSSKMFITGLITPLFMFEIDDRTIEIDIVVHWHIMNFMNNPEYNNGQKFCY